MEERNGLGGPVQPRSAQHLAVRPLDGGAVRLEPGFWGRRQLLNREVTIPHGARMLQERGSLDNLRLAAGQWQGAYTMPLFMDSDVYKVLEAMAWEHQHGPLGALERFRQETGELLAAAQTPEGYLNSYVQVVKPGKRFEDPAMGHELYCAGHMFQAGVAEARSAAPASPLGAVVERFAGYLVDVMAEKRSFVPGHPEIEMALVERYRQTGSAPLLDLAADLIGRRGQSSLSFGSFGPEYFQDDVEVTKADRVRGHAVRALYLLSGVADLYIETGRRELLGTCLSQWEDMTSAKTYLTAGVGSRHQDEAFGDPFELPPDRAYCETCAAVANIMWNWRMCLITGEARFAELIERALYNGFLASWSLDGQNFFYVNPLQSRGGVQRQPWYRCACCPPNLMRLVATLEHYMATRSNDGLQLHQFMSATIRQELAGGALGISVSTTYPQEGEVQIGVREAPAAVADIALRVPSWATNMVVELNGVAQGAEPGPDGYLHLRRRWEIGDELSVSFPLRPRVVRPDSRIDAVRGCAALERGPLVYCFELLGDGPENLDGVELLEAQAPVEGPGEISGEPVRELRCRARRSSTDRRHWPYFEGAAARPESARDVTLSAVPYYAWSNRGPSQMRVWLPRSSG